MSRTIIIAIAGLMLLIPISLVCATPQNDKSPAERDAVWQVLRDVLPADALKAIAGPLGIELTDPAANDDLIDLPKPRADVIVRGANLQNVPIKRLPTVNVQALLDEDAQMAQFSKALRFGVGRNLLAEMRDGQWIHLKGDKQDGWLWVMDAQSDGAIALRLHVLNMLLPDGATLIAYDPHAAKVDLAKSVVGPYEEGGPFDDGDIWLPTIGSQIARVECWVPTVALAAADQPPQQPLFVVDRLQHIYRDPFRVSGAEVGGGGDAGGGGGIGGGVIDTEGGIAGAGCHNQIACHPEWLETANAVAGIGTIGDNSLFCTGQLIRTQSDDHTPYFLTAHHCLSTNGEARTSEIYWRYQASTCGGSPPSLLSVPHSNVCSLVRTDSGPDFTLLMIEGPLPANPTWASWTSADAVDGTDVVCIHHPLGTQKRISFGTKASNPTCGQLISHIRVNWTDGVTEPGSSGSGVFRADTAELIGQLHCGSSACGNVTNDSFGGFFVTYGLISDILDAGSDDSFEPNATCGTAATLTPGTYPGLVVKSTDLDWYKIHVPPGKRLTVRANFKDAWGDIDMRLYTTCGGTPVDSSLSTGNVEEVTYLNTGASAINMRLKVYIVGDVRNKYKLTVTLTDG